MRDALIYGAGVRAQRAVLAAAGLWLPWDRRGDLAGVLGELAARDDAPRRLGWKRVRRRTLPWFESLVDAVFARSWLEVRAVVGLGAESEGDGGAPLRALIAHVNAHAGAGGSHRARLGASRAEVAAAAIDPMPIGPGHTRLVEVRRSPPLQLARFFAAALQAAYGGRPRTRAQLQLLAYLAERAGAPDLDLQSCGTGTRGKLLVWRPRELVGTSGGARSLP